MVVVHKHSTGGSMKTLFRSLVTVFLVSFSSHAQYSNASLDNAWIIHVPALEDPAGVFWVYATFDGHGVMNVAGAFGVPSPAGSYSVNSDGTFSITGMFSGALKSDSTGSIPADSSVNFVKVKNMNLCKGTWTGTFLANTATKNVILVVGDSGKVISCSPFASPIGGHVFAQAGHVAGFITTGDPLVNNESWDQIRLHGTLSGQTMSGSVLVQNGPEGNIAFNLTRTQSNIKIMPQQAVSRYNNHSASMLFDLQGRFVYHKHSSFAGVPDGVYILQTDNAEFSGSKISLMQKP
jgi:hypothetical protein